MEEDLELTNFELAALKARHMEKVSRLKMVEEQAVTAEQKNKTLQVRGAGKGGARGLGA